MEKEPAKDPKDTRSPAKVKAAPGTSEPDKPKKRQFRVHKSSGTSLVVITEAETIEFCQGGSLAFWNGGKLVMAYSPSKWQTVSEEEPPKDDAAAEEAADGHQAGAARGEAGSETGGAPVAQSQAH